MLLCRLTILTFILFFANFNTHAGFFDWLETRKYIKTSGNVQGYIKSDLFSTDRGLPEVLQIFEGFPSFYSALVKEECYVLNSGAGEYYFEKQIYGDTGEFIMDHSINRFYSTRMLRPINKNCNEVLTEHKQVTIDNANKIKNNKANIRITSLGYFKPPADFEHHENHSVISGEFFENIPNKKILKKSRDGFNVITDCWGPFAYSNNDEHRMQIITRYRELVKKTGEIFIFSSNSDIKTLEKKVQESNEYKLTIDVYGVGPVSSAALIKNTL